MIKRVPSKKPSKYFSCPKCKKVLLKTNPMSDHKSWIRADGEPMGGLSTNAACWGCGEPYDLSSKKTVFLGPKEVEKLHKKKVVEKLKPPKIVKAESALGMLGKN